MEFTTWWLIAHFAALDAAVLGISAAKLGVDWERVSVLSIERIDREIAAADRDEIAGVEFDVRVDLDRDGTSERVVAGVYEAQGGESGRFLLVAEGSDENGWRSAYVCGEPGHANFSSVKVDDHEVYWFSCLHCDVSVVLRHESGRYTLGDSEAASYTGTCK
jgi:hypothetical protein